MAEDGVPDLETAHGNNVVPDVESLKIITALFQSTKTIQAELCQVLTQAELC